MTVLAVLRFNLSVLNPWREGREYLLSNLACRKRLLKRFFTVIVLPFHLFTWYLLFLLSVTLHNVGLENRLTARICVIKIKAIPMMKT